jgi:hypothetical protein
VNGSYNILRKEFPNAFSDSQARAFAGDRGAAVAPWCLDGKWRADTGSAVLSGRLNKSLCHICHKFAILFVAVVNMSVLEQLASNGHTSMNSLPCSLFLNQIATASPRAVSLIVIVLHVYTDEVHMGQPARWQR